MLFRSGLIRIGMPVLLGGTSNHLKRDALDAVGGWDAWNVTEDADLSFRLTAGGFRIADLPSATYEEAPTTMRMWFRQRVRWKKGYLQTTITHGRKPRALFLKAGLARGLTLYGLCAGALVGSLGYPIFAAGTIAALWLNGLPEPETPEQAALTILWLTLMFSGMVAAAAPLLLGARHRGLGQLTWWIVLVPLYYAAMSCAAWTALFEYVRAPTRWNKTEHGLARSSRSGFTLGLRD